MTTRSAGSMVSRGVLVVLAMCVVSVAGRVEADRRDPVADRARALALLVHSEEKGDPETMEAILAALGDVEWRIRAAAALSLAELPVTEESNRRLVAALGDVDVDVSASAAFAIATRGARLPGVEDTLRSRLPAARRDAQLFMACGLVRQVESSLTAEERRAIAVAGLVELGGALRSKDGWHVARIARCVAILDDEIALGSLEFLTLIGSGDKIGDPANNARAAIAAIGDVLPSSSKWALRGLTDSDPRTRRRAAVTLSLLRPEGREEIRALAACAKRTSESLDVRVSCLQSLRRFGATAKSEIRVVRRLVRSQNSALRAAAAVTLVEISAEASAHEQKWLRSRDPTLAKRIESTIFLRSLDPN